MDLVVVGDVMVDVSVEAGSLARGGDVHGEVRVRPGGSGANAAVWAAEAGARVRLHGRVGDDLAGRLLRQALEARGVEAALTVDAEARTGTMLVVREAGDRSMVADRGANARLSPEDLPQALQARAVLVSGYLLLHEGSEAAGVAALERAAARHVGVDAASWPLLQAFGPERFLEATSRATVLFANAREAEVLAGPDPALAARRLARRYEVVCVKLGRRGAVLAGPRGSVWRPAEAVEEVDPTGAGDAFDGVFLAALAAGRSPETALAAACAAGAHAAASPELWPERGDRP